MTLDALLYHLVVGLLNVNIWGGELIDGENLPQQGPAVFVANHARALGPIAVTSSLPFRVYPWVIGDMLVWKQAPTYLNRDFVGPGLHVPPALSMLLSQLIAQVSVRLLRAVQSIPVWQGDQLLETYRLSLDFLERGRRLLIFPEDPEEPMDEASGLRPFKKGFARLGEMYYARTQKLLFFYPLAVHERLRQVRLGKPISFNPNNDPARERARLMHVLETAIRNMLFEMTMHYYAGVPLPR